MLMYGNAALKQPTQDDCFTPELQSDPEPDQNNSSVCDSKQTLADTCFCVTRSGPDRWSLCSSFVLEVIKTTQWFCARVGDAPDRADTGHSSQSSMNHQ